jgi:tetratricopeptide (TPR) repeat protein
MTRKVRKKPAAAPKPAIDPATAKPVTRLRRSIWIPVVGAGFLALLVGLTYWWWSRSATIDPQLPGDIDDSEVRAVLEKAQSQVKAAPRSAASWGNLAMTLQANGYGAEAGPYFAEAQRLDPRDGRWPYFRALAVMGEDSDAALPFLRQAAAGKLPEKGQESAVRLRLAEALLERQELAEAEELFQMEWQKHPDDPRAGFGLGLIAQAREDGESAEKYLSAARKSPSASKSAIAQLAALARRRGDPQSADKLDRDFASLPNETPPWLDPLLIELSRKRVGAAASAQALTQLEAQHRFQEAANLYIQQLKLQPTAQNYVGAGLNAVFAGHYDYGLKLLHQAILIDPDRADSHFALAQALFQVGMSQREQAPDSLSAKAHLLGVAEAARRAVELKPDNASAYLLWGRALMNRGDWDAAVLPLQKGAHIRPELLEMQLALGEALLETGRLPEAEIHLKNALKLNAKDDRPAKGLKRIEQTKK